MPNQNSARLARKKMSEDTVDLRQQLELVEVDPCTNAMPSSPNVRCTSDVGLSERLISILEAERGKIAREIHDEAGQLLISAAFNLDQALAMLPQAFVARDLLEQARQALDECAEELHRLAFNLRPRMLDDLGLIPALRSYLKRYSNLSNAELDINLGMPRKKLNPVTELAIFRIVQEASANIAKYSQATVVRLNLCFTDRYAELEISDNGIGFDASSIAQAQGERPSLGLNGMRERAAALGGELRIESIPAVGTTIRAYFPIGDADDNSMQRSG